MMNCGDRDPVRDGSWILLCRRLKKLPFHRLPVPPPPPYLWWGHVAVLTEHVGG